MARALSLLSVPGTDSRRFRQTLLTCLRSGENISLNEAGEVIARQRGGEADQLGIFICDPAVRLKQSYDGLRQQGKAVGTFEDFYSKPGRINYLSQQLAGLDVSSLGFVGLQESYAKSLLLAEVWAGESLSTVSPSKLLDVSRQVLATINETDYAAIRQLHSTDYVLYQQIQRLFEERLTAYIAKVTIPFNLPQCRSMVLHLGPPKTGTSTIQSWLLQNRSTLKQSGVVYPRHHYDDNGISSGNFTTFLSSSDKQNWYFDDAKAERSIRRLSTHDNQLLLLSSEHFYYSLPWLFSRFPNACFVFYVRHPLSLIESNYHQHVKRHRADYEFLQPETATFEQLAAVSDIARQFSVKVSYRYLERSLMVNNSLIDDFVSLLPVQNTGSGESRKVNTQYRPGALELMRVCNRFLDAHLLQDLDSFLQSVSEDHPAFSMLSPDKIMQLAKQLKEQAVSLVANDTELDEDKIQALLSGYKQPPYFSEMMRTQDMEACIKLLAAHRPALATSIMAQAKQQNEHTIYRKIGAYVSVERVRPFMQKVRKRIFRYFK